MNFKKLDLSQWKRINQYQFFKKYENPFFNICSRLDVTDLLKATKQGGLSFSSALLFASIDTANKIPEFKYRLYEEGVIECNEIYAGSTVLSDDNTFSFCYFDYYKEFSKFYQNAMKQNERGKNGKLEFDGRNDDIDIIHYSVIPWIEFSSFSHPRNYGTNDSIPKIVFGKYYEDNGRIMLPISIEVHHALMDGWHLGQYLQKLQKMLSISDFIC